MGGKKNVKKNNPVDLLLGLPHHGGWSHGHPTHPQPAAFYPERGGAT